MPGHDQSQCRAGSGTSDRCNSCRILDAYPTLIDLSRLIPQSLRGAARSEGTVFDIPLMLFSRTHGTFRDYGDISILLDVTIPADTSFPQIDARLGPFLESVIDGSGVRHALNIRSTSTGSQSRGLA